MTRWGARPPKLYGILLVLHGGKNNGQDFTRPWCQCLGEPDDRCLSLAYRERQRDMMGVGWGRDAE